MALRRRPAAGSPAHVIAAIGNFTHTGDYAGQPFSLRAWQARILRSLFQRGANGLRQYRTALLMLPRKNGKTELCAAIALYCLLFDTNQGEIYLAAADRDQAGKVFQAIVSMIRCDATLTAQCVIVESQKRIVHMASGSFCRAISAEAYSKHGFNASVVIYDELHCAQNRELWDVLATSQGGRQQPLMIAISTAGFDRQSILWELYAHAKKVAERPTLDPTFLPIIYEAPAEADWTDEAVWKRANPALGDFRSLEEMRIACARAREIPAQENTFRRLYLNQWTEQASRWIALEAWDACRHPLERAALRGRRCFVGMDLSTTTDLTAIVAVFPDGEGGGFDVLPAFFVPRERIHERSTRDRVPYEQWARDGVLTATPGATVDYEAVRATLRAWAAEFAVQEIAFDPWNATDLVTRLTGQDGFTCVPMRQGFASLSAPTKSLERSILARELRHGGDPVLRWNMSNVAIEQDAAGNLKVSKRLSTERIDGAVALVMACDLKDRNRAAAVPDYQMLILSSR